MSEGMPSSVCKRLRPLMPRPSHEELPTMDSLNPQLGFSCFQNNISHETPSSSVGGSTNGSSSTTRWNPTTEQVRMLEDWYRKGLRTPTAQQIQYMTFRLRLHGRIEGKNVFYWFQNHKARERQKRRRMLEMELNAHHHTSPLLLPEVPLFFQPYHQRPFYGIHSKEFGGMNYLLKLGSTTTHINDKKGEEKKGSFPMWSSTTKEKAGVVEEEDCVCECCFSSKNKELVTLELFPLNAENDKSFTGKHVCEEASVELRENGKNHHHSFFEFLPLP